jgi:hypothetical protein
MRIRLDHFAIVPGGVEFDAHVDDFTEPCEAEQPPAAEPPATPPPPAEPPQPAAPPPLPEGFNSNQTVAFGMLLASMQRHNLDPVAVQGHGKLVADALNSDYPGLFAYAHPTSDALMWPGFGSVDCTINSGKGGFYFRPDGQGAYDADYARSHQ